MSNALPGAEEIEGQAVAESKNIVQQHNALPNAQNWISNIVSKGAKFLSIRGLDGRKVSNTELLEHYGLRPNILFADQVFQTDFADLKFIYQNRPVSIQNAQEWYDFAHVMDDKMTEFFEVRGL